MLSTAKESPALFSGTSTLASRHLSEVEDDVSPGFEAESPSAAFLIVQDNAVLSTVLFTQCISGHSTL